MKTAQTVTPLDVAIQVKNAHTRRNAAYQAQVKAAQAERQRRIEARRNGYRGPITRADLASTR